MTKLMALLPLIALLPLRPSVSFAATREPATASETPHPSRDLAWNGALARGGLSYRGRLAYQLSREREWNGSRTLLAKAGTLIARVSIERAADAAAARRRIAQWRGRLLLSFEGAAAYPGVVTRSVEALARPKEVRSKDSTRLVLETPATERLSVGAGAPESSTLRALVSYRECPDDHAVAQVELFWLAGSFDKSAALDEEAAYDCRRPSPRPLHPPPRER